RVARPIEGRVRAAGVPGGLVRTVGGAIRSEEARERDIVTRIPGPGGKWVPNVALPIRYAETPLANPVSAPAVGQHSWEILRDVLEYDEDRVAALADAGVLGQQVSRPMATES